MTLYNKIPTTDRPSPSEIAAWIIAAFIFGTLGALTLWDAWLIPVVAKLFGGLYECETR